MNFSDFISISISGLPVVQISDLSGNVLWSLSGVEPEQGVIYIVSDYSYAQYEGTWPEGTYTKYDNSGYGGTSTWSNGSGAYLFKAFSTFYGQANWAINPSIIAQYDSEPYNQFSCFSTGASVIYDGEEIPPTSGWNTVTVSGQLPDAEPSE